MPVLETVSAIATIGSFCVEVPRVANGVRKFSDKTLDLAACKVDRSFRTLECFYNILEAAEVQHCMDVYDKNKQAIEGALQIQKSSKKLDTILSYWKQRKYRKELLSNAEDFEELVNKTSMGARVRHMRSKGKNTSPTVPPGVEPAHENAIQSVDNQIPLQVVNTSRAESSTTNSTERSLSLEEARALLRCPGCGSKQIPKSAYVELPSSPGSQKNHARGMMICDQCGISRLPPQHESATAEDSNQT